ncbi:MAG: RluA family pseudouridine synthase [Anaerovibrio sp.]|uniref:RluA family pseudouridine synthase n=1 Tax=Anaerovibrio sp. TaxID=1872532 RepID=UPI0025E26E8F|nr:RluA family pseudouridine synthase [Anaerovibrio sp.]MCR5176679.1 RluA family pseudouridine synthase [Anaerovibrio sp.]
MNITFQVKEALSPTPVRAFLQNQCGISHGMWRRLKWNGTIKVNEVSVRATTATVKNGDLVTCILPEESSVVPAKIPLDIRFEDEYMIVINKPAGILVHPTGHDYTNTIGNGLKYYYKSTGQDIEFHPVHRLDRNTTGLVLVAKLPQLQSTLTQPNNKNKAILDENNLPGKLFHRSYLAVINGILPKASGIINLPIARHPQSIIQRICNPQGQYAETHYRTIAINKGKSLLELELKTGRTHQIRVHMAAIGFPLMGDDLYGGDTSEIKRQALHAYHLEVLNPLTMERQSIYSDIPNDMVDAFYS